MITEHFISPELSIPIINEQYFCSRRDPVREASAWANLHTKEIEQADKIVVLGLGAGFHLHFIPRGKEVYFVEFEQALIERFEKICPDSIAKPLTSVGQLKGARILKFQPAIANSAELYQAIANYPSINIKVIAEMLKHYPALEEVKCWNSLRELVV